MASAPFKKCVVFNETTLTVYSIGWLALLVSRHVGTLRVMEKEGVLPQPIFHEQMGNDVRYYTAAELLGYSEILKSNRLPPGRSLKGESKKGVLRSKMRLFKTQLKQAMARGKNVISTLPNEDRFEKAFENRPDKDYKAIAARIIKLNRSAQDND